jgi:hypothetical protein
MARESRMAVLKAESSNIKLAIDLLTDKSYR